MNCKKHDDGKHKSLFINFNKDKNTITHTCVCWLPSDLSGFGVRKFENVSGHDSEAGKVQVW